MTAAPAPGHDPVVAALRAAATDPAPVAQRWRSRGEPVVGVLGACVPREVIAAAGALAVRLPVWPPGVCAGERTSWLRFKGTGLDAATASQLAAIVDGAYPWLDGLVIGRDTEAHAKLFAVLRELDRTRLAPALLPIAFVDVAWLRRPASARYNRAQVEHLGTELRDWFGHPVTGDALRRACAEADAGRRRVRELLTPRRLSGSEVFAVVAASQVLPTGELDEQLDRIAADAGARPALTGGRVVTAGSPPPDDRVVRLVESAGWVVVGEDHDRGERAVAPDRDLRAGEGDPWSAIAARWHRGAPPSPFTAASARAGALVETAAAAGADVVLYTVIDGDPAAGWDVPAVTERLTAAGIPLVVARDDTDLAGRARWLAELAEPPVPVRRPGPDPPAPRSPAPPAVAVAPSQQTATAGGARGAPVLASTRAIIGHQREWFQDVRRRAAEGEPVALVNADVPHELFRALDIPYVVNQWWSSLLSARQLAPPALAALAAAGYPDTSEQYSALGFGHLLAGARAERPGAELSAEPWGGLPEPSVFCAAASSDAMAKLFEAWAARSGGRLVLLERSYETRLAIERAWWERLPDDWDEVLQRERIDLMVADIEALVAELEALTGRTLDLDRLAGILDLVNEHETWYGRARDLVARSVPAPVSIADTVPATMVPQWHRGTTWGRDAARALHDEIEARVRGGEAACPEERMRLMWLGRGLWSDLGLTSEFQERYGAVFVWSMYLALAADGYVRRWRAETSGSRDRDALRSLAARYVPMGDELRLPTWSAAWHVHEARTHQVDGVVSLGEDDWFSIRALEEAGIPVLRLDQDNTDRRGTDAGALRDEVARFLEERVEPVAERRREGRR